MMQRILGAWRWWGAVVFVVFLTLLVLGGLCLRKPSSWNAAQDSLQESYPEGPERLQYALAIRNQLLTQWGTGGFESVQSFLTSADGQAPGSQRRTLSVRFDDINMLLATPQVFHAESKFESLQSDCLWQCEGDWVWMRQLKAGVVLRVQFEWQVEGVHGERVHMQPRKAWIGSLRIPLSWVRPAMAHSLAWCFDSGVPVLDGRNEGTMSFPIDSRRRGRIVETRLYSNGFSLARWVVPVE